MHSDLKQYGHLLYFFIAVERRQATILSIKIPLFKKLKVFILQKMFTLKVTHILIHIPKYKMILCIMVSFSVGSF